MTAMNNHINILSNRYGNPIAWVNGKYIFAVAKVKKATHKPVNCAKLGGNKNV